MPQWDAEIAVDTERARSLIGERFPELAGADIELLAAGWDNTVFRVDGRWAFRFPRREIAVPGVEREIAVLPRLAGNLPLPIPEPRWVGAPGNGFPWPWFGAPYLPGRELVEAGTSDDDRIGIGGALGAFLHRLHAPDLRSRIGPTLPLDPYRRADMPFRVGITRERLDELAEAGLWQTTAEIDRLLADAAALPPSSRLVVLHGDLHARHVLVDAGRASGVIDWGDVCIGDPALDLSIAYGAFGGAARAALLDAYGRTVDGITELRARVIAVWLAIALLAYADDVGNEPLRTEAAGALDRAVS